MYIKFTYTQKKYTTMCIFKQDEREYNYLKSKKKNTFKNIYLEKNHNRELNYNRRKIK